MVAEYGNYVYNQRLFHLYDDGIISERDIVWGVEEQKRYDPGKLQVTVKGRSAILFFSGLILLAMGCAAIGVNFMPASYSSHPKPAYAVRPLYATVVLICTGIVLCLGALLLFSNAFNKIIFYERGFRLITFFGLRGRTVMYRDIRRIEKHPVHTTKGSFDSYMIYTDRKKYNWTADNYIGAAQATDLLLYKCFQKQ